MMPPEERGPLTRGRMEDALRESEERLSAILQNTPAVVYLMTPDSRFIHINRRFEELFGLVNEDVRGKSVYEVFPPETAAAFEANNREVIGRRAPVEFEEVAPHPGGPRTYASVKAPLFDAAGAPSGVVGISTDITGRKRAEESLRDAMAVVERSRAQLEAVFQSVGDGVVVMDAAGAVVFVNEAEARINGYASADEMKRDLAYFTEVYELSHPDGRVLPVEEWPVSKVLRGESVSNWELRGRRRDTGQEWFFSFSGEPVRDERGGQIMAVTVTRDITEHKRAEAERERLLLREQALRAEAEAANRLKDEFLSVVSHELRTPLTAIVGWAHLLRAGALDEETGRRALAAIERNARAQAQIIEDVLDVSRIVTGKLRLDLRRVAPAVPFEAALDTVRPTAEAKGVRLDAALDREAGPVLGDADRLQQVAWNLLTNAVKFTPAGGRVELRLGQEEGHVRLTVSDTGRGISREFLPHVFERFRQADSSTTREYGGLGLGLSVVRHLVEMHGGTVGVESAGEGLGARFTVRLPRAKDGAEGGAAERAAGDETLSGEGGERAGLRALGGLRVLVVDDEEDTRELLRVVLGRRGAEVQAAASADEAVKVLEQWAPDVLVSDIGMPREDGYSLINRVRERDRALGRHTPALALTGYVRHADRERALLAGFDAHAAKPVEPDELTEAVAHLAGAREL